MEQIAPSEERPLCPDCGTRLSDEPWATGLCPNCLLRLGLEQPSMLAEIESQLRREADPRRYGSASVDSFTDLDSVSAPGAPGTPDDGDTLDLAPRALRQGLVLGGRFRIRTLLGRGGMGEVWRAFDLKLRVDVALKALHPRLLQDSRALATLRTEVRSAREVVSANVCRVFDLVELEGRELVTTEYVDGMTLHRILVERSPIDLDEARDVAAQMLAGLEAIHEAGLVHRDVKPENVMITRAGRVVVMDFGIASALRAADPATVAGTPAYMAPEQARGGELDRRADVFAAGMVLAEMVDSGGVHTPDARRRFWQRSRKDPPRLAETPWAPILARALAVRREDRPASAAEFSRALEEIIARASGEQATPYPGLASFTEQHAENFFGRELEVEAMWKKLRRLHLLGLIGPSGTGKTSFLRAGLLPARPPGCAVLIVKPGIRPFTTLAEALADELAGDTDAVRELVGFEQPGKAVAAMRRWRERHEQAVVVVDQFEELFTQCPTETRERFTELLGRLTTEADVRVVVSLRDDFLAACGAHPALAPIFEALTLLNPLTGSGLRRAVVQPALRHGFRFEDEALVDEILAEVEGERGALPLLAFAAAELWRRRDRERGLLTRDAYEQIGGVAGALARHAEATMDEIGAEREPIVRGLFRRLVTSQGTRATWDRDELLSAFDDREAVEETLAALIDARLLSSYEVDTGGDRAGGAEKRTAHRVEIIHESLLRSWPRLVRWQHQDEDSAHLLDQLRPRISETRRRGHARSPTPTS